jgi:hypothetical protein
MKFALSSIAALLLSPAVAAAQMAAPTPLTPSQFAASATGQNVILAVRVETAARTAVTAELLERITDARYKATGKRVTLYVPEETPIVMGSAADVKPGAILFVYAVTTTAAHADVKKVVVVTPYAAIE